MSGPASFVEFHEAEVEQLDQTGRRHHDVGRLHVAMNDAEIVNVIECCRQLSDEATDASFVQRSLSGNDIPEV